MNRTGKGEQIAWVLALICVIAGAVSFTHALQAGQEIVDGLNTKQKRIDELTVLQAQAAKIRAASATLEQEIQTKPVSIKQLTDTYLENAEVVRKVLPAVAIGNGWELQRADIQFSHLTWEAISIFLRKAEEQRPPWRIEAVSFTPHNDAGLSGKLTLQALQKSER